MLFTRPTAAYTSCMHRMQPLTSVVAYITIVLCTAGPHRSSSQLLVSEGLLRWLVLGLMRLHTSSTPVLASRGLQRLLALAGTASDSAPQCTPATSTLNRSRTLLRCPQLTLRWGPMSRLARVAEELSTSQIQVGCRAAPCILSSLHATNHAVWIRAHPVSLLQSGLAACNAALSAVSNMLFLTQPVSASQMQANRSWCMWHCICCHKCLMLAHLPTSLLHVCCHLPQTVQATTTPYRCSLQKPA